MTACFACYTYVNKASAKLVDKKVATMKCLECAGLGCAVCDFEEQDIPKIKFFYCCDDDDCQAKAVAKLSQMSSFLLLRGQPPSRPLVMPRILKHGDIAKRRREWEWYYKLTNLDTAPN